MINNTLYAHGRCGIHFTYYNWEPGLRWIMVQIIPTTGRASGDACTLTRNELRCNGRKTTWPIGSGEGVSIAERRLAAELTEMEGYWKLTNGCFQLDNLCSEGCQLPGACLDCHGELERLLGRSWSRPLKVKLYVQVRHRLKTLRQSLGCYA